MAVENIITDGGLGVVTICSGVLGRDEFIDAVRRRYEPEESLRDRRYFLTDHSAVTDFAMESKDIFALSKITTAASMINPDIHLASVVPRDLAFGMVRMWGGYAHDLAWAFRICRSRPEAERWLRDEIDPGLTFR